jgi:hypothetical protein
VTVVSKGGHYRREVCAECPWRKDAKIGAFPAEAYRHSASTGYDCHIGQSTFACHMSGESIQTCAGFLLSESADDNLAVRIAESTGQIDRNKIRKTVDTYATYREMAIANGEPEDDPVIAKCRTRRGR